MTIADRRLAAAAAATGLALLLALPAAAQEQEPTTISAIERGDAQGDEKAAQHGSDFGDATRAGGGQAGEPRHRPGADQRDQTGHNRSDGGDDLEYLQYRHFFYPFVMWRASLLPRTQSPQRPGRCARR